jgi:hypothetical protein
MEAVIIWLSQREVYHSKVHTITNGVQLVKALEQNRAVPLLFRP